MKINKKLLGFGTLALPVVVAASMFFAMNPNINLLNKVQADDVSGSIEFSTTAGTRTLPGNNTIITSGKTSGGFPLYSYAVDNSLTNISSSTIANTCQTYGYIYFSESSTELNHFKFQGVNAVTITTSESSFKYIEISKSVDGENFVVDTLDSGFFSSKTVNVSSLKYLRIKVYGSSANQYIEVSKIILGYNCSTSYTGDNLASISAVDPITEYTKDGIFVKPDVIATYEDTTIKNVTDYALFSGFDLSTTGEQTVTVSYTEKGIEKTTQYSINVTEGSSGSVAEHLVDHGTFAMTCKESSQIIGELTFTSSTSGTLKVQNTNQFTAWTENQTFNWSISVDSITVSFNNISSPSSSSHAHLESSNKLTVTFDGSNNITALSLPLTNSLARTLVFSI
ncbi:MAG: hypothetical protein IJK27_04605 [Bacilli bacterium]|nr:hypothetical protein [Bacilli bacterium]